MSVTACGYGRPAKSPRARRTAAARRAPELGLVVASVLAAVLLLGCSSRRSPIDAGTPAPSGSQAPTVPAIVGQLEPPRLNFPIGGIGSSTIALEPAFPRLTFTRPVFLTHPRDGTDRIFVLEQAGHIRVFPNDPTTTQIRLFLDLTPLTGWGTGEAGLLGLAFDPDYAANGYFYVNYTRPNPLRTFISRFQVSSTDPDFADASSEQILLTFAQPYPNHNGGMLAFGPDGMLYIGVGDGGNTGDPHLHAQNLSTLFGSILRIDPHGNSAGTYGIPADNPFVGVAGARGEIWAYGLRNPWRFAFDRANGRLWAADVGQDEREEIDVITRGGNYGWNVYEGDLPYRNPNNLPPGEFDQPVSVFDHSLGKSVVGGYVYRGGKYPSLRGLYFLADHVSGDMWTLADRNGAFVRTKVAQQALISSFGEDRDGELYATTLLGDVLHLQRRVPDVEPPFPLWLSETGIFSDIVNLVPTEGLIEFHVNAPLYSDDAVKRRWLAPGRGKIVYQDDGPWSYPLGTVFIKHFELPLDADNTSIKRRVETRVFVHEVSGWAGYTYKWNDAQTDAELQLYRSSQDFVISDSSAAGGSRIQTWTYPSRADCANCHNPAVGAVLGGRTNQLNKPVWYRGALTSQITYWNDLRLFDRDVQVTPATPALSDPADPARPVEERARSYLDVNCATCHRPNGPGRGNVDLRYGIPSWQMAIEWWPAMFGDLGVPFGLIVFPQSKENSVLWERMRRLDRNRMPAIGSNRIDPLGVTLIGEYIDALR